LKKEKYIADYALDHNDGRLAARTLRSMRIPLQTFRQWARLTVLNLCLVAAAGVLLRYKILFPLPSVHHKNLLHGHSHFAFSGWVSLALFTAITYVLSENKRIAPGRYTVLFWLTQLAAFGMLFTFPFMGYNAVSIAFSTLSIFFSYAFAWVAWKDIASSAIPGMVRCWFYAALLFYVLSSAGAFHLAYLMAGKTGSQSLYIGSVYFFLHFQYNGWFLFAILGLFFYQLHSMGVPLRRKYVWFVFRALFFACFPAFLLSTLWMQLSSVLYWIAAIAGLVQVGALLLIIRLLAPLRNKVLAQLAPATRWLWSLALIAFSIKILLQAISAIPSLSYLAFGFRPVVIGYLHLILLGFVSLSLLGYYVQQQLLIGGSATSTFAIGLFTVGVILNEAFLFVQGIAATMYTAISFINYLLFGAAILLFAAPLLLLLAQLRITATAGLSLQAAQQTQSN